VPPTRRTIGYALGLIALVLLVGRALADLRVDQLWYASMGAGAVWREKMLDLTLLRGAGFLGGTLFAFANLYAVRRSIVAVAVPTRVGNIEIPAVVPPRRLFWLCVVGAVVLGAGLAAPLTGWERVAMARHGLAFNDGEGVFERDFGFYVYWLPIENAAYLWMLLALTAIGMLVFFLYALTRSLRLEDRRFRATTHVRRHLSVLAALVLMLLAWSYRLDAYDLFSMGSGPEGTFVSADRLVAQPADLWLAFLALLGAVIVLRTGWVGQVRTALGTITVVIVAALLGRQIAPMLVAGVDRGPDPLRGERAYLDARAAYSRRAFAVDAFALRPSAEEGVALPVLRDVAVWDDGHTRDWLTRSDRDRQLSGALGHALGDDPAGGGILRAVAVQSPTATSASRRWAVSMLDIGGADDRGALVRATAAIDPPLIHDGAIGARVIDDSSSAVAVPLDGSLSRLAFAWSLRDPSVLFKRVGGGASESGAQIVTRRDVRERVRALVPVFAQGDAIRPLLHQGSLLWVLELYAVSERYPISERVPFGDGVASYLRHAATALVDGNSGRVQLVLASAPDPITRSWQQRFPDLFVAPSTLPPTLAAALPAPAEMAVAQALVLARYGARAPADVQPRRIAEASAPLGTAPAMIDGVIGYAIPLVGADDRVDGLLLAMGGAYRGTRWVPFRGTTPRWPELVDRAREAAAPATDSAATPRVPRALRSTTAPARVILVNGLPAAVMPAFAVDADERPTLDRVAVAISAATSATGGSVAEATRRLSGSPSALEARRLPLPSDYRRLYDAMRAALARGDWLRFGAAFDSLGRVLP
jgi:uncharacterized protein